MENGAIAPFLFYRHFLYLASCKTKAMTKTNWQESFKPLIKKYKGKAHPLEYKNLYQLVVMVILSAQDSDKHINQVAPNRKSTRLNSSHIQKSRMPSSA